MYHKKAPLRPGLQASIGDTCSDSSHLFLCALRTIYVAPTVSWCIREFTTTWLKTFKTKVHDYGRLSCYFLYGFCLPQNTATGTCNVAHTLFMFAAMYVGVIHVLLSPKTHPKRVRAIKTHKVMADDDSLSFGAGDIIFVIDK